MVLELTNGMKYLNKQESTILTLVDENNAAATMQQYWESRYTKFLYFPNASISQAALRRILVAAQNHKVKVLRICAVE